MSQHWEKGKGGVGLPRRRKKTTEMMAGLRRAMGETSGAQLTFHEPGGRGSWNRGFCVPYPYAQQDCVGGQGAREAGSKGLEKKISGVRTKRRFMEVWDLSSAPHHRGVWPGTCHSSSLGLSVQSVSGKGQVALCLPCPGYVSLPFPVGQADLHGIPQLVGQVVRADAIGEALRQEHGQQPGERWGGSPGSHPSAPISSSGFRCEGSGEPPPAAPPGLPLQAPVGGGTAPPGRPGAELLGAQHISHPETLPQPCRMGNVATGHFRLHYGGCRGTIFLREKGLLLLCLISTSDMVPFQPPGPASTSRGWSFLVLVLCSILSGAAGALWLARRWRYWLCCDPRLPVMGTREEGVPRGLVLTQCSHRIFSLCGLGQVNVPSGPQVPSLLWGQRLYFTPVPSTQHVVGAWTVFMNQWMHACWELEPNDRRGPVKIPFWLVCGFFVCLFSFWCLWPSTGNFLPFSLPNKWIK